MKNLLLIALVHMLLTTSASAQEYEWWELIDPSTPNANYEIIQDDDEVDFNFDDDFEAELDTPLERMRRDYAREKLQDRIDDDVPTGSTKPLPVKKPVLKPAPLQQVASATTCEKGAKIVTSFGFETVAPKRCVGKTYSYSATRGGKPFEVSVDTKTGELGSVKKL